jgi:predicted dehydrogenase
VVSARVAVLGASGFGRHHARWYAELGADVVAFLGSGPDSVAATTSALREAFGFHGHGYTHLQELLDRERPDAVSVCTPPPLHAAHARTAIEAGCAVLCEKPFVWRPGAPAADVVAEAEALVAVAEQRGALLSVQTQYAAAAEAYAALAPETARKTFLGVMTSQLKPGGPRGADIWVDLAPHPLSFLLALLPDARLVRDTVHARIEDEGTDAEFDVRAGDHLCHARIQTRKLPEKPFPRQFGFDDHVADVGSAPGADGVYRGILSLDAQQRMCDDFMKTSISRFLAALAGEAEPLVSASQAVRNLEMMLAVLEAAT